MFKSTDTIIEINKDFENISQIINENEFKNEKLKVDDSYHDNVNLNIINLNSTPNKNLDEMRNTTPLYALGLENSLDDEKSVNYRESYKVESLSTNPKSKFDASNDLSDENNKLTDISTRLKEYESNQISNSSKKPQQTLSLTVNQIEYTNKHNFWLI